MITQVQLNTQGQINRKRHDLLEESVEVMQTVVYNNADIRINID